MFRVLGERGRGRLCLTKMFCSGWEGEPADISWCQQKNWLVHSESSANFKYFHFRLSELATRRGDSHNIQNQCSRSDRRKQVRMLEGWWGWIIILWHQSDVNSITLVIKSPIYIASARAGPLRATTRRSEYPHAEPSWIGWLPCWDYLEFLVIWKPDTKLINNYVRKNEYYFSKKWMPFLEKNVTIVQIWKGGGTFGLNL